MNALKHPVFIVAAVFTAANGLIERMGYSVPYINSYLDDLACFPVVLTLSLAFLRIVSGKAGYTLNRMQIVLAVIYFSIVFEGVLPAVSVNYTRDPFDIIAYIAGALLFSNFINKKSIRQMASKEN